MSACRNFCAPSNSALNSSSVARDTSISDSLLSTVPTMGWSAREARQEQRASD